MASVSGWLWPGPGMDRRNPDGYVVYSPHNDSGIAGVSRCTFCGSAGSGYPDTDMDETARERIGALNLL